MRDGFADQADQLRAALVDAEQEASALAKKKGQSSGAGGSEVLKKEWTIEPIAALVQKPSRDFPLKQGRERSPEIDIPAWQIHFTFRFSNRFSNSFSNSPAVGLAIAQP